MICIKSNKEIEKLRRAGELTAGALQAAGEALRPGMTTHELDRVVERYFISHGAKPGFKGYEGFPAAACISVNDEQPEKAYWLMASTPIPIFAEIIFSQFWRA